MANKLFKKSSSGTSPVKMLKKTSTGQVQCPVYRKTATGMERIDQTLVTKTKVFSGYAQWNGSYRNSTGTGTAYSDYSGADDRLRMYQGKYSSYHHLGLMCFKSIFKQVRDFGGEITKVTLKMKNLHSYYNAGLNTKVCGAINMPDSKPSSFSFSNAKSTSYDGTQHFDKGETRTLTLDDSVYNAIKKDEIDGFRLLSPTGFTLTDYGYFEGEGSSRPYIEITVKYEEWE